MGILRVSYVYTLKAVIECQKKRKRKKLPGDSDGKESVCNVGDLGLIPGSGISPGEGNGNPLQYSCLENSMDRGA